LLLLTDGQDFQREQEQSARDVCEKAGFEFEVAYADNSPFMQIRQVLEYIERPLNMRPVAISIELASAPSAFTQVARAALTAGVGWVELSSGESVVQSLHHEFPGHLVASVTADEEAIGELHASQCRALLPKGGSILYVEGPSVNTIVRDRRLALEKGLQGSSITIAKTLAADWTAEGARLATIAWLRQASARRVHPDLVCSQNDAMAVGVQKAARAERVGWAGIPMLGCDGVPSVGQQYVKEGTLAATVIKPVTAGPAVDWIVRRIRGEKPPRYLVLRPTSFPALQELTGRQ
jgi:ribose transport system substrate-binding protein